MCVRFFYFPTAAGWMLLPCCKSQRLSLHTRWKDSTKNKVESRKSIGPIGPWHAISLTNDSHHVTELDQEGPPDQSQSSRDPKHPTKGIKNSSMPFYLLLLFISRLHFFFFPTRDLVIFHQTQHHPPVIGYIFFISCLLLLVKQNQSHSWIIQRIPINSLPFFNPPTKKDLFFLISLFHLIKMFLFSFCAIQWSECLHFGQAEKEDGDLFNPPLSHSSLLKPAEERLTKGNNLRFSF